MIIIIVLDLNTTHVSVQLWGFEPIHTVYLKFKYNPCIGSMIKISALKSSVVDLNTTHVSVQLYFKDFDGSTVGDLNTTHVSVQSHL